MPSTINLYRVFKAPPRRVYKAFVDPDSMAKWLPPYGFTRAIPRPKPRLAPTTTAVLTDRSLIIVFRAGRGDHPS
jgi:hypothetical protein